MDRNEFRVGDRVRPTGGGREMTAYLVTDNWVQAQFEEDGRLTCGVWRWDELEWAETPDWVVKLD